MLVRADDEPSITATPTANADNEQDSTPVIPGELPARQPSRLRSTM